jgi:hypothetical protein
MQSNSRVQSKETTMITDTTFQDTVLRYEAEESRGNFYDIAVNLLNQWFKMEAYLLLLATWNFASFRYAVTSFDLVAFEGTVKSLETNFQRLDGKNIKTADFDSLREDITIIYDALSQIRGIKYTGAPKIMHLRNRELFVMWDGYIRGGKPRRAYEELEIMRHGDWEAKAYGKSASDYLGYLKDMQRKFAGISFVEEGKTFAKAIDEFNYVSVTLPMQTMERAARRKPSEVTVAPSAERVVRMVNTETFREALQRIFDESPAGFIDVNAKELYSKVGGGTGRKYNMAGCCYVMTKAMQPGDKTVAGPPSGKGATLTIRYILPR